MLNFTKIYLYYLFYYQYTLFSVYFVNFAKIQNILIKQTAFMKKGNALIATFSEKAGIQLFFFCDVNGTKIAHISLSLCWQQIY